MNLKINILLVLTLTFSILSCNTSSSENESLKKEISLLKKEQTEKREAQQFETQKPNFVKLTIVAKVNPDGKKELSHYIEKVGELYKKVKAKPIYKFKITKPLIGTYTPSIVSIMEFPSISALNDVFESDEYKKLIPYREKAFSKLEGYISE